MRILNIARHSFDNENKFRVAGIRGDVSLYSGYNRIDDGILWGMQNAGLIKAHYSEADKPHRNRMNQYEPIKNGEEVKIEGKVYVARILGNYSDCVIFDPKG